MNECTNGELRDLLPELVNGRLNASMQLRVEAHVASCTECAGELALLRSLRPALAREPAVDTERIAAAVRARTAGATSHAPARERISVRWRVAIAAAALLAVSALGYVARTHRTSSVPEVAAVPSAQSGTRDSGFATRAAPESARGPRGAAPRTAPVHAPSQQVAVAPPHAAAIATPSPELANVGVLDNLADLSDEDLSTLSASLDKISAVPDADPSPAIDPLGASLDDASAGGR